MKVIYKESLAVHAMLLMPVGSRIVEVEMQGGNPCIWFECDPSAALERRTFILHGTGHPIPPGRTYVGTVHDDGLVFHVYEQQP